MVFNAWDMHHVLNTIGIIHMIIRMMKTNMRMFVRR